MRRFGLFSHDGLSSIKYVVVKTLIEKITQIKRPRYQIWVIYPRLGTNSLQ